MPSRDSRPSAIPGDAGLDWTLLEHGLTLPERIALHRRRPDAFTPDPTRAEAVAARWRDVLGRAADASIADRLADLELDEADLPAVVGAVAADALAEDARSEGDGKAGTLSAWLDVCAEVCAWRGPCDDAGLPTADFLGTARASEPDRDDDEDDAGDDADGAMPFEHALVPWVEVATRRLFGLVPDLARTLDERILRGERRRLLRDLASFLRFAAMDDLDRRRVGIYSGNDFVFGLLVREPPRTAYFATVRSMVGEATGDWMRRRAGLARLLAVRVIGWARGLAEFVARLEADRDDLVAAFGDGEPLGSLVGLRFGSGDSHHGGRSVAICRFGGGRTVVYKPRRCRIDTAFASVLDAVNRELDPELRLRAPRVLDRGAWGWFEFVEGGPCDDLAGLRRYHRRMGVLLAIVHTLQGNDFHLENVMAVGDAPVPIDLETVCVPRTLGDHPEARVDPTHDLVERSVLRTLLLPSVMSVGGGPLRNLGAIRVESGGDGDTGGRSVRRLDRVNTDFQRWIRVPDPSLDRRPESEATTTTGESLDAADQQRETLDGFVAAYRAIRARQADWTGEASPIRGLSDAWVRVLHRATNVYGRLLMESCGATSVATGVDRWVTLERLAVILHDDVPESQRAGRAAVVRAEIEAMIDGDIPCFIAPGDGRTNWTVDPDTAEPIELPAATLGASAVEVALEQAARMSEDDLALQCRLQGDAYRGTILSLTASGGVAESLPLPTVPETAATAATLRTRVVEALERIVALAIRADGATNWIDLPFDPASETIRPAALDAGLYSGRGGLALLFERAYRLLGDERWLGHARDALAVEVESFASGAVRDPVLRGVPGGMGPRAGLVAGAWAVGRHESCGRFREVAREVAVSMSDRTIAADGEHDVIGGVAGYLLLLRRLHEEEPIPGVAEAVGRLADRLVAVARTNDPDGLGWSRRPGSLSLCGFGHGRAGIGLALLEAGRLLDRLDLRSVALAAMEAEHRLRGGTPAEGWPDRRGLGTDQRDQVRRDPGRWGGTGWCGGTEGIALSRAAALQIEDAPFLADDLAFALETVRPLDAGGRPHVCCGRSGRVLTHRALRRLGVEVGAGANADPDSDPDADETAGAAVRAHLASLFELAATDPPPLHGVGLFQGWGGLIWTAMTVLEDDGSDLLLMRP